MKILNLIAISYVAVVFILLHATLLFCGAQHCIVPFQKPPVEAEIAYRIRVSISSLLPFQLKTLQIWAQWLVIGEIMALIIWTIKRLQSFICCMIWLLLAFALTIAILAILSHSNLSHIAKQTVLNSDLISQQQMESFTSSLNETIQDLKDFIAK